MKIATAKNFLRPLKEIEVAVSLGSVSSYIEIPYTMSHHDIAAGRIPENLIRFSVGYEDFEVLKEDLFCGIKNVKEVGSMHVYNFNEFK
ncbi:MAG: PLP-dependent transferase [Candidatus Brennerbacteria bacterium]|nr:PLP-dependent transferase [Candidatus Brennerbacteria bacterium]